ncbi:hypothetical protein [Gordonia sp. i37]|uniref:hypothetical protein n=1 Tax=Gordonia sp. i37 TaxID=1961707 RepID=UPI0009AD86E7|nr:hypothetical protein [Gordonia sp. i37]OPX06301.1 hypothetical protein B1964_28755 [Gordonia sp. i37]
MTYISTPETISTTGADAPPLHFAKYKFGTGYRLVINQGGNGISFPIEDAERVAAAIINTIGA